MEDLFLGRDFPDRTGWNSHGNWVGSDHVPGAHYGARSHGRACPHERVTVRDASVEHCSMPYDDVNVISASYS
jgi:hypothetical protein